MKARYADLDFIDDVVALSIISDLLALGAKPMLRRRKRQKEANMLAIHDRIRLRYHTLKLRAPCWVLRRMRARLAAGVVRGDQQTGKSQRPQRRGRPRRVIEGGVRALSTSGRGAPSLI